LKKTTNIYDELLTVFLVTVVTGLSTGFFILSAVNYLTRSGIKDRPLVLMLIPAAILLICLVYWLVKLFKSNKDVKVLAVFMLIVTLIGSGAGTFSNIRNIKALRVIEVGELLKVTDEVLIAGNILDFFKGLRTGNNYVQLIYSVEGGDEFVTDPVTGESSLSEQTTQFFALAYNTKGEFVLQDSNDEYTTVVGLNGGTLIDFSADGVAITRGSDPLALGELLANAVAAKQSGYRIEEMPGETLDGFYGAGFSEMAQGYVLTAEGDKAVRDLYALASGEAYGETIDTMLSDYKKQGMGTPSLTMDFLSDGTNTLAALRLGTEATGQEMLWYYAGSAPISEWSLPEDWYSYDFGDAEHNADILESLMASMTEMLGAAESETGDGGAVEGAEWE
jgi:hypothetical protein